MKIGDFYRGEILYVVTARLDVQYQSNLNCEQRFIVNEKFDKTVAPSFAQNNKSFMLTKGKA